ncbi:hypothetical protein C7957_1232 [Halanaerobium saccharolyticum]|uniref:DUF8076 domain-containing protein n=2 Tax=Halanaerobium saccharolyticum TaxID=43595 RepID=A0A4R6RS11_9FIRM|nr:hypothetical protein C7957_1232 [Halanaerobium saccharolyticum]
MTKIYNKENYLDEEFVEKMSIIQFMKLLDKKDKRIETQIEVYGLEEFLYYTGKEEGIKILKKYFDKGIDYLSNNFAIIKIILEQKISVWNGKPIIKYKNEEYPLTNIFGTSLKQQESEFWTANTNINS